MRPVELRRTAGLWGARPCLTPRPSQFYGAGERLWERAAEVSGLPAGVSTLQAPHSGARSAHRSAVASGPTRLGRGGPALLLSRDAPWGLQPLETHRRLAPLSVLLPRVSGPSPLSLNLHPVVPGAVDAGTQLLSISIVPPIHQGDRDTNNPGVLKIDFQNQQHRAWLGHLLKMQTLRPLLRPAETETSSAGDRDAAEV